MLWEDSKSLRRLVPWLPRHVALPAVSAVFLVVNLVIIVVASAKGYYHLDYYTYWNFAIVTIYHLGNLTLYPLEGWPIAMFTAIWGPITRGSTANVMLIILTVIGIDDRVYIAGTAADATLAVPLFSFRVIRTADWIIHGLPVLEVMVVDLFDYQIYCRGLVYHWERSAPWRRRIGYWAYFYVSPLIPMIIYMSIFDPRKKYTNKLSRAAGFGIAAGINFVVMTVYLLSLRTSETRPIKLPDFYPPYLHAPPTKPPSRARAQTTGR